MPNLNRNPSSLFGYLDTDKVHTDNNTGKTVGGTNLGIKKYFYIESKPPETDVTKEKIFRNNLGYKLKMESYCWIGHKLANR